MHRFLLLAVLLFSGSAFADDCASVVGIWQIDKFHDGIQAQIETEIYFFDSGYFRSTTRADDGVDVRYYGDSGQWSCNNGVIELQFDDCRYCLHAADIVYYELHEANASYMAFHEIRDDDPIDVVRPVRQAIRLAETSYPPC